MAYNAAPNLPNKYSSGYYVLINKEKYIGDPAKIVFRSSLENRFCKLVDNSPKVIRWGSEIVDIPYIGQDGKKHIYHMDFYIEAENNDKTGYDKMLIEIKPSVEVDRIFENKPPEKPKKTTPTSLRNWEYALKEFIKNKLKWSTTQQFAKDRGLVFKIVTEKTIDSFL